MTLMIRAALTGRLSECGAHRDAAKSWPGSRAWEATPGSTPDVPASVICGWYEGTEISDGVFPVESDRVSRREAAAEGLRRVQHGGGQLRSGCPGDDAVLVGDRQTVL